MKNQKQRSKSARPRRVDKFDQKEIREIVEDRTGNFAADQRAQAKELRYEANANRKPLVTNIKGQKPDTGRRRVGKMVKAAPKGKELHARLEGYLQVLEKPFGAQPVKCPINYNPAPSLMTSTASTPYSSVSTSVAANTTTEIILFPGHGWNSDTDAMDGESYHACVQTVVAVDHMIGPASTGTHTRMQGVLTTGVTLGNSTTVTTGAASSPITNTVALPYVASQGDGAHTRWKLLAAGIRVQNTTVIGSRGGNVASVQPNAATNGAGTQASFSQQPSYLISTLANTGTFELSWIPRPSDMAFWHSISTAEQAAQTSSAIAGMRVWLNNPTAVAQTYTFELQFHWELGGASLVALSSPAILQPADKSVIEPSLDIVRFGGADPRGITAIARGVASTLSPFAMPIAQHALAAGRVVAGRLGTAGVQAAIGLLGL